MATAHTSQARYRELRSLGDAIRSLGAARPLLVLDRAPMSASSLRPELDAALDGLDLAVCDGVEPNPTLTLAIAAAALALEHRADVVISLGGGSAIDLGKLASILAPHDKQIDSASDSWDLPKRLDQLRSTSPALPHIAIPTTAGSGSEATQFAVVYVDGVKRSIDLPQLAPAAAILDARLHLGMPPTVAAASGLDALCQAIESCWAVRATPDSQRLAVDAGHRIASALATSANEGDLASRTTMMHAAHDAGRAINITRTTASHALSYPLTATLGLAHGHAVALTIGAVAARNSRVSANTCNDPRGPAAVRDRVLDACGIMGTTPAGLLGTMRTLLRELRLPATLREAGLGRDQIDGITRAVDPQRLSNNPTRLDADDLCEILTESLGDEAASPR